MRTRKSSQTWEHRLWFLELSYDNFMGERIRKARGLWRYLVLFMPLADNMSSSYFHNVTFEF